MNQSSSSTATPESVQAAITQTLAQLRLYEEQHGRTPSSVALLAVSKTKPISLIKAALAAGQRDFGENYLDEALEKISKLGEEPCRWHFIGQIQSNKTALIASHFDWVHGIDREKIASRLAAQRPEHLPPLNCCIQLNIDEETSKAGVLAEQLPALCQHIMALPRLRLRGLMCIPAPRQDFEQQRTIFHAISSELNHLKSDYPELDTLSMGMSADTEAAVAEGSTMVRIGTALFGARAKKQN